MDMLDKLAFSRWVEYMKRTNLEGIDWPTWREAYNRGLIQ